MLSFSAWFTNFSLAVSTEGLEPLKTLTGPEFPFWQYTIKILTVLSAMVGALLLVLAIWKRLAPKYQRHPSLIRVLATHYLAPKQALILVAVGQKTFLLASSANNLHILPLAQEESAAWSESLPTPQL
jgi:flagellar biogenesis protein FliO|uniref:Flagellar protein n=1 Tax=Desulfobacca acetoxidans TaxID=60893 RepID=A0A7V6A0Y9_9BACT